MRVDLKLLAFVKTAWSVHLILRLSGARDRLSSSEEGNPYSLTMECLVLLEYLHPLGLLSSPTSSFLFEEMELGLGC